MSATSTHDGLGLSELRFGEILRELTGSAQSPGPHSPEALETVAAHLEAHPDRPLIRATTTELLAQYAAILTELRARGVVRTSNAPLGDYAEYIALEVYGGALAPNSAKSYDIAAADGRLVQVKARAWSPAMRAGESFSVFRSFDFDVAVLTLFDARTYEIRWAKEMTPEQIKAVARWSQHVRGYLLSIAAAERDGIDVTPAFERVLARSDPPGASSGRSTGAP